jgi:hypothetical protein
MSGGDSPFLDILSFEVPPQPEASRRGMSSPFVDAFALEPSEQDEDPGGAARRILLAELYDEELDDAIYELVGEVAGFAGNGSGRNTGILTLHLAPLADEIETFIQRAADQFGPRDPGTIDESEIEEVLRRSAPEPRLAPGFEHFFDSIRKTVQRVASGAVRLTKAGIGAAAKLGLGPMLEQLKKLVRPLLARVLKAAIHRLPVGLQPAARTLAQKLPTLARGEVAYDGDDGEPAVDLGVIQK